MRSDMSSTAKLSEQLKEFIDHYSFVLHNDRGEGSLAQEYKVNRGWWVVVRAQRVWQYVDHARLHA